jgi:hypothetical protein
MATQTSYASVILQHMPLLHASPPRSSRKRLQTPQQILKKLKSKKQSYFQRNSATPALQKIFRPVHMLKIALMPAMGTCARALEIHVSTP